MRLQNTVRKRIKYAQFCRHLRRIALGAKRKGAGAPRTPRQERGAFLKYTWEERRAFLKYRRRFQMGSERKRQCVLRGSLTVEAALLMPVIFLVVFMSIYLTVHIRSRNGRNRTRSVPFASGERPCTLPGRCFGELRFPRAMTSAGRCLICGRSRRRKGCWIKSPA